MMNSRELNIKCISHYFAYIEVQIKNLNSQNLCDLNIISEKWICDILNMVFDYELKSVNLEKSNYPSIDLVDHLNRIAIQVTSDKSKAKIQKTLNAFGENHFVEKYDKLIIFILGEKQRRYSKLIIPPNLQFEVSESILEFNLLLKQISFLPLRRIEKINKYLKAEFSVPYKEKQNNAAQSNFKKTLAFKKRIIKDLVRNMKENEWRKYGAFLYYDPSIKFIYSHLIVRSYKDKSFPDYNNQSNFSWMKLEIWDFYENGIEFIHMASEYVIIDEDQSWYLTKERGDNVCKECCLFLRISYDSIVSYDMEPDQYYGYPTIFVNCDDSDTPFDEEIYGIGGYYNQKHPEKSRKTVYLDSKKRKREL